MPTFAEYYRAEGREERREEALSFARDAVTEVLQARFGAIPPALQGRVAGVSDLAILKDLLKQALAARTLDDFAQHLPH